MNRHWTESEIYQLRTHFLQGKPIKVIARDLGRTPTALNKAISRFGIRPLRSFKHRKSLSSLQISTSFPAKQTRVHEKSCSISFNPLHKIPNQIVDLAQVLQFLKDEGVEVQVISAQGNVFILNYASVNAQQIVLKANQIRTERGLPIFSVPYLVS
jgi:hypothetical protein